MDEYQMKEVYYHEYCKDCKFQDLPPDSDPCNECLTIPAREYSHKPEKFEGKFQKTPKKKRLRD